MVLSPATPSISTKQQPATATVGASVADQATVTGLVNPSANDTVTFNLYSSATTQNASTLLFTDAETLSSGSATSKGYTTTIVATDYWVATYNGDSNNASVSSGKADEPVVISPASPSINTTPSMTAGTAGNVVAGQFATIGFWHNQNGQAVINSFNGSSSSKLLGNWLATNFPHLFGASNPYLSTSLGGLINAQVAAAYLNLWTPSGLTKNTYVQAFAVALGLYADTSSLGGASLVTSGLAAQYGFVVTASGAGTFSVGNDGAAFGVANGTSLPVTTILQTVNSNFSSSTGLFFGGDQTKTSAANDVLNSINSVGDIPGTSASLTTTGGKLMDSATLSGGVQPDRHDHVLPVRARRHAERADSNNVYTDTVTVSGNGIYTTAAGTNPGGYVPTATGTYQWVAVYGGAPTTAGTTSPFGSEPFDRRARPARPSTPSQAAPSYSGSGAKLTDTATLAAGVNPTGTITFYLFAPGVTPNSTDSNDVYSDTVTVSANSTYSTATGNQPGGYVPTTTGTYQWVAVYSGDSKNNPVSGPFGDEPEMRHGDARQHQRPQVP